MTKKIDISDDKHIVKIDIGCGSPDQKKKGYIGLDANPDYKPDMLVDCSKGIPLETRTVDYVWSDNSLEHFPNPHYVLAECNRVLKYGGVIELKLPNTQYLPIQCAGFFGDVLKMWNWWMNSKWKTGRSQHYTLWTKEVLRLQLEDNGFRVVKMNGCYLGKEIYCMAIKEQKVNKQ